MFLFTLFSSLAFASGTVCNDGFVSTFEAGSSCIQHGGFATSEWSIDTGVSDNGYVFHNLYKFEKNDSIDALVYSCYTIPDGVGIRLTINFGKDFKNIPTYFGSFNGNSPILVFAVKGNEATPIYGWDISGMDGSIFMTKSSKSIRTDGAAILYQEDLKSIVESDYIYVKLKFDDIFEVHKINLPGLKEKAISTHRLCSYKVRPI